MGAERSLLRSLREYPAATVPYFRPDETGHDAHGNSFLTSWRYAYLERAGPSSEALSQLLPEQVTRAGLLVSPEGQNIIRANPGMLRQLDEALGRIRLSTEASQFSSQPVGKNGSLRYYDRGSLTDVYLLQIPGNDIALRIICYPDTDQPFGIGKQPYIKEMLQMQELQATLGGCLSELKVRFPQWYFASGLVGAREFIHGRSGHEVPETLERLYDIAEITKDYVKKQKQQGNELWLGVETDHRKRNCVIEDDGTLVLIDLFTYDRHKAANDKKNIVKV